MSEFRCAICFLNVIFFELFVLCELAIIAPSLRNVPAEMPWEREQKNMFCVRRGVRWGERDRRTDGRVDDLKERGEKHNDPPSLDRPWGYVGTRLLHVPFSVLPILNDQQFSKKIDFRKFGNLLLNFQYLVVLFFWGAGVHYRWPWEKKKTETVGVNVMITWGWINQQTDDVIAHFILSHVKRSISPPLKSAWFTPLPTEGIFF